VPKRLVALAIVLFAVSTAGTWAQTDVTVPGDPVVRVDGSNDGDPDSGPPPAAETEIHAIDDVGQKYLNFLDLNSGFIVTPAFGPSVVTGLRLYTANDFEDRDPASYVLEGSTTGDAGPFTLISEGPLNLPSDRNPGGSFVPVFNQEISFSNTVAYISYRLTFPTLKDASAANSMQIGEVEFLGTAPTPTPTQPAVPVPALDSWALILLPFLLLGAVLVGRRNTASR